MRKKIIFFILLNLIAKDILANDSIEKIDNNIGIARLSEKVYLMKSSFNCNGSLDCNHMLVVDLKDIVLINTPVNDSLTGILLNCIRQKFKRPVTKVVISHFHEDSSGGIAETNRNGITSYSLDKTKELLKSHGRFIDVVFKDSIEINLQTVHIELYFPGAGHTFDNIVVWLPEEKILFGGCLIKSLSVNDKGNIKDADMQSWAETVLRVKNRFSNAKIVIPGHFDCGDTSLFDHTIKLVHLK